MTALLFIAAVLVGIVGFVKILEGDPVTGIVLIIVAFLIGPGGYSLYNYFR